MNALVHAVENLVTLQTASLFIGALGFVVWIMIYCWKGDV